MDDVALKATYQNFRMAVATSNQAVQDALRPQLLRSRDAIIRIAEGALAHARTPGDRRLAELTLGFLKEQP
jgi:hypothetical protein